MDKENKALLELNSEIIGILESKEYNLGRRLLKYFDIFRKFEVMELIKRIQHEKMVKRSSKFNDRIGSKNFYEEGEALPESERVALYTCITGKYDTVKEPVYISDNVDCFLYTDSYYNDSSAVWNKRSVPQVDTIESKNALNRYCKMHPFELFPDYDYAIYIDGNVLITSDVTYLCSIAKKATAGIAMHLHPARSCAYNEALACIELKRGKKELIEKQIISYKNEGFPENFGMREATIIVVDLKNEIAKRIFSLWWDDFCLRKSERDQISFPYAVWKAGVTMDCIGILGNNKKYNPYFRITTHE